MEEEFVVEGRADVGVWERAGRCHVQLEDCVVQREGQVVGVGVQDLSGVEAIDCEGDGGGGRGIRDDVSVPVVPGEGCLTGGDRPEIGRYVGCKVASCCNMSVVLLPI